MDNDLKQYEEAERINAFVSSISPHGGADIIRYIDSFKSIKYTGCKLDEKSQKLDEFDDLCVLYLSATFESIMFIYPLSGQFINPICRFLDAIFERVND